MSTIADVLEGRARWAVVHGDCLDVLPTIERVDHVLTDPPYEVECHTKQRRHRAVNDGRMRSAALEFEPISEGQRIRCGEHFARIARRWSLVFCQVEAAMAWREALGAERYVRTMVWIKPDASPQFTGDRPGMGYESIVVAHPTTRKRWNGGGRRGVFEHTVRGHEAATMPGEHPTVKPLPLMIELVELFTDPGDVVLDPFAGSGSTGVACMRLGRRFVGIEKNPTYAQLARDRVQAEERDSTLQAQRAGQLPMFAGGSR